jgi:hypothetical protein
MNKTKWLVVIYVLMSLSVADAQAQMVQWEDRGYLSVNLGIQPQSRDFTELAAPDIYGDPAAITVPHSVGAAVFPDLSVGIRLTGNIGVAVGFSTFSKSETPSLSAQIPHPVFGGVFRSATASAGEMSHRETAFHTHFLWMIPLNEDFDAAILVGPSFYSVKQDLIATVAPLEGSAPFTSVGISSVTLADESESAVAFTVGFDGTYRVTPRYGAGFFFRYSGASVDLPLAGGGTLPVDAGGVQLGFGLRVRF